MLERLEMEVAQCRGEIPFLLPSNVLPSSSSSSAAEGGSAETSNIPLATERETGNNSNSADAGSSETPAVTVETETPVVAMDTTEATGGASVAAGNRDFTPQLLTRAAGKAFSSGVLCTCMPERAALIKSILNFLKKAIPEPTFSENMRTCESFHLLPLPSFVPVISVVNLSLSSLSFSCSCGLLTATLSQAHRQ